MCRSNLVRFIVVLILVLTTLLGAAAPGMTQQPVLQPLPYKSIAVDAVWSATFDGELGATVKLLENPTYYNYFGRRAVVGKRYGADVLALVTGTQPLAAIEAMTMLPYHFPPKEGKYLLFTHGGIAGGYYQPFIEGDPSLQPADSLSPDRVCAVDSFYIQPVRVRGWIEIQEGDSLWKIAKQLTGDGQRWKELWELNKNRLELKNPNVIEEGMVFLSPWDSSVFDRYIPYGGKIFSQNTPYRLPPENPCFELSSEAKSLRDQVLAEMARIPLPQTIVDYRKVKFPDAREQAVVYQGYAEGGGWSWFASPNEARRQEEFWGVRMGDMESHVIAFSLASQFGENIEADKSGSLTSAIEINALFFRTSSDPPDGFNGPAVEGADFLADPKGTFAKARTLYDTGSTGNVVIPFNDLIAYQSAQFAAFNDTALKLVMAGRPSQPPQEPIATPAPTAKPEAQTTPVSPPPTPVPTSVPPVTLKQIKAGVILVGPAGDMGWSWKHNEGIKEMTVELGKNVEVTVVEAVAESDAERVIRDLAIKGYNAIYATSFGYMDAVINVARDFPNVQFFHCTGYEFNNTNISIYDARGYQGMYLAGMIAGKMTKKNVIGYIMPYPIPECVRNLNALALGAQSVNPAVTIRFVQINAWFDPAKEREATQALIDQGCDVIVRESDSAEPEKLCAEEGVWAIGYNSESTKLAPASALTSVNLNWGPYYSRTAKAIASGSWKPGVWWGNMAEGAVSLGPFGTMVPQEIRDLVAKTQAKIVSQLFDVFVGPIFDQSGTQRVAGGVTLPDEGKLSMNWLVKGVIGSIQ